MYFVASYQDLAATSAAIEGKDLERVGLCVKRELHEIDGVVRLHEEVKILESLPRKEGFHVVVRLAARILQKGGIGEREGKVCQSPTSVWCVTHIN